MSIKFWRTKESYGCFSNFSKHSITIDGIIFLTSEHYFQAQKFYKFNGDFNDDMKDVVNAKTPRDAADIGRDRNRPLRKDWEQVKDQVMEFIVEQKLLQHKNILELLLSTNEEEEIIEDSPYDYYWGCGKDGSGKNMLGKILMKLRTKFRNEKVKDEQIFIDMIEGSTTTKLISSL